MTDKVQAVLSRDLILGELLARNARKFPDRTALVFLEKRFTYAQMNSRVNRLANALAAMGLRKGDKVGLLLYNCNEMVECYFACNKLGAVAVPINFRLAEREVQYIVDNSESKVLIFGDEFVETVPSLLEGLEKVNLYVHVGENNCEIKDLKKYEKLLADSPDNEPFIEVYDNDEAFIMYTSGTTGQPKGAVLTHKNLFMNTANWIMEVGADHDSVWVSGLPLFHIGGLDGILPFLYLGGVNVIMKSTGFDAEESLRLLDKERASHCYFVPTQWQDFINLPNFHDFNLIHLKKALWGASIAPESVLQGMAKHFPQTEIINAFGQTEMSSNTTFLKGKDAVRKIGSVGKPVVNLEVRVVDGKDNDVNPGEIGEIVYRGPTVFKEYFNNPVATEESMRGGWFHSGDLVREDKEGYLYVVDRKKDMIISGGENIYPAEVERVLHAHAKIKEAAVIGVSDAKWVETPKAIIVLHDDENISKAEVIAFCKENLASYKKPKYVVFIDDLPRNAAGKVLKTVLREEHGTADDD